MSSLARSRFLATPNLRLAERRAPPRRAKPPRRAPAPRRAPRAGRTRARPSREGGRAASAPARHALRRFRPSRVRFRPALPLFPQPRSSKRIPAGGRGPRGVFCPPCPRSLRGRGVGEDGPATAPGGGRSAPRPPPWLCPGRSPASRPCLRSLRSRGAAAGGRRAWSGRRCRLCSLAAAAAAAPRGRGAGPGRGWRVQCRGLRFTERCPSGESELCAAMRRAAAPAVAGGSAAALWTESGTAAPAVAGGSAAALWTESGTAAPQSERPAPRRWVPGGGGRTAAERGKGEGRERAASGGVRTGLHPSNPRARPSAAGGNDGAPQIPVGAVPGWRAGGAVGGAGSWLSPPFLLPSLEGQASCPSRPSASPRSAARPWPRRRRARRPCPRPRKGGGKSRREGGVGRPRPAASPHSLRSLPSPLSHNGPPRPLLVQGNGGKHKSIGAEQPLEVPEPSPCPQGQGCTRPGADRSVLESGRKVPDGCRVLGGQRALTLAGWAVWFLFHRFLGVLILTSPNPQLLYLLDAVQDGIRQPNLRFTFSLTLCVGRVAQQILEPGTGTCCVCHCWSEKQSLGECRSPHLLCVHALLTELFVLGKKRGGWAATE
ncbi:translation initiation factor IF-2-like [Pyrgilauda ruficollis]|uniref:translation initiation factor IF-2-like n=1 Tax=Pyrgilauda ruficollis TaxID=221976 RepID=UPI001B87AAFB|nr:translation initiation factor IF-2-like [Pyrgilauda ruficollis]